MPSWLERSNVIGRMTESPRREDSHAEGVIVEFYASKDLPFATFAPLRLCENH